MIDEILNDAEDRMQKSINLVKDQFISLAFGGVGGAIDNLKIEYYGSMTPLLQLALITAPYRGKYVIRPHDPATLKEIERTIHKANLGCNVMTDKNSVHVTAPTPTIDAKERLVEHAAKLANDAKLAVRKIRQDARTKIKKADLPQDDEKKADKDLQTMTDLFCQDVDVLLESKKVSLLS